MSRIRGKDTKPEMRVRKFLHARGFRYKLHDTSLPGKPDIVLPKYKAVVNVHGCFWHGHHCHLFKWPKTNRDFWKKKIEGNILRDQKRLAEYSVAGWRSLIIWECAMKGSKRFSPSELIRRIENWIYRGESSMELRG